MRRYDPSPLRAIASVTAVAMTAITLGLTIVLPATMDSGSQRTHTRAAQPAPAVATSASPVVAVDPRCVEADAHRKPKTESVEVRNAPKLKQNG